MNREQFQTNTGEAKMVPFGTITCEDELNIRSRYDDKEDEAFRADIAKRGLLEPIGVTNGEPNSYKVAYGYRRYFALKANKVGADTLIPVIVRPTEQVEGGIDGKARVSANFAENDQRADVSDYDRCQRLRDMRMGDYPVAKGEVATPFTTAELCELTGKSEAMVQNMIGCIENLCPAVMKVWKKQDIPLRLLFAWKGMKVEIQNEDGTKTKVPDEKRQEKALAEYLAKQEALESLGRERSPAGGSSNEDGDGPSKPSAKQLLRELAVMTFKAETLKGKEREVLETGISLYRHVIGELARNPLISAADEKALEQALEAEKEAEREAKAAAKAAEKEVLKGKKAPNKKGSAKNFAKGKKKD